nr:hypothetical protein [Fodinibius sp.]NIV13676.1 hypothetical protein [Fodinibius sp.]NIY27418.1 hypothetical protein [Fodinibius sp.]
AAALERQGITTIAIQLLREVALKVTPPRALWVPFRHGYPLGHPGDAKEQSDVIQFALTILENEELAPPVLIEYATKSSAKEAF